MPARPIPAAVATPAPRSHRIALLGFDGCLPSGIVGLADMLWLADQATHSPGVAASANAAGQHRFDVCTVSIDGKALHDGRGRRLAVDAAATDLPVCDAVLVPGLVPAADGLPPHTAAMRRAGDWLRRQHAHGALVGGSCAGVFVLGDAGLLDHRRCTTTWWLHEVLKERHPRADVVWGSPLLAVDRVVTVGGPLSWIDLALHTVGALAGPAAARATADFAVIDNAPMTQALYAPRGFLTRHDPLLLHAEQCVRTAAPGLTTAALAQALGTSERTLHRRLRELASETPKAFITRIRMETSRTLLEQRDASVKRVARQSGYADEASFRRAFTRHAGMSPAAYRRWLQTRMQRGGVDA